MILNYTFEPFQYFLLPFFIKEDVLFTSVTCGKDSPMSFSSKQMLSIYLSGVLCCDDWLVYSGSVCSYPYTVYFQLSLIDIIFRIFWMSSVFPALKWHCFMKSNQSYIRRIMHLMSRAPSTCVHCIHTLMSCGMWEYPSPIIFRVPQILDRPRV